jgi:hypothetical protein
MASSSAALIGLTPACLSVSLFSREEMIRFQGGDDTVRLVKLHALATNPTKKSELMERASTIHLYASQHGSPWRSSPSLLIS